MNFTLHIWRQKNTSSDGSFVTYDVENIDSDTSFLEMLDHLNEKTGISFILTKNIPLNSGFSSNAASAVAGVFAVNALLGKPLKRYDLLPFAEAAATKFNINPFPAQVCSILFGGIILYKNDKTYFDKLHPTPRKGFLDVSQN